MIVISGILPSIKVEPELQNRRAAVRPPRFLVSVVLLAVIALLLPEQAFEFVHMGGQECSKPDLISGFIHLKNKRITWTQEGFSSGSTNSIGFVDCEHAVEKPPGVCRIAMLGDSMTESLQVPQDSRFSNLLERRLNAVYPGRFEVFNFGISAAGPGQDLLTYLRYVRQFKPDVTILFFESGDEDKDGRKPFMAPWHPHVVFSLQNENLTVSWRDFDSWLHSVAAMPVVLFEPLRNKSHLWGVLIQRFNQIKTDASFQGLCVCLDRLRLLTPIEDGLVVGLPVSRFGPSEFKKSQQEIYSSRSDFCASSGLVCVDAPDVPISRFNEANFRFACEPEFHTRHLTVEQQAGLVRRDRERWKLTTAILKRLAIECERQGSKFVIVGFPPLAGKKEFDSAFIHNVTALADRKSVYAVDLTPLFEVLALKANVSPRIATHLSVAGHQIMADLLFHYMTQQQSILSQCSDFCLDRSRTQIKVEGCDESVLLRHGKVSTPKL